MLNTMIELEVEAFYNKSKIAATIDTLLWSVNRKLFTRIIYVQSIPKYLFNQWQFDM